MSVMLDTSLGEIVIDLFVDEAPKTCRNFLKLCKIKYYNNCLFHCVIKDFLVSLWLVCAVMSLNGVAS